MTTKPISALAEEEVDSSADSFWGRVYFFR